MDATASREASWDQASNLQGEMFQETASKGGLEIQLSLFPWVWRVSCELLDHRKSEDLLGLMTEVRCRAGETQIRKVLRHALTETKKQSVDALIFIGDNVEEDIDSLGGRQVSLVCLGFLHFFFRKVKIK